MQRNKHKTAYFTCTCTGCASNAKLSCAVLAIETLFQWIIGTSVLVDINVRFPLMNNVSLSVGMLSSIKVIYKKLDWSSLLVENTKQGSKVWMIKLFQEHPIGFYWVQADLKDILNFAADHVISVQIVQD